MSKKPDNHYVDNDEFYAEMCEWKKDYYEVLKAENLQVIPLKEFLASKELGAIKGEKKKSRFPPLPMDIKPRVTESIGAKIWLICTNLTYNKSFIRYSFRDEMILNAVENCIKYIHNFDEERFKRPFSYFNFIAWQAFVRQIKKDKFRREKREEYIRNLGILDDAIFHSDYNSQFQEQAIQDNIQRFFDN